MSAKLKAPDWRGVSYESSLIARRTSWCDDVKSKAWSVCETVDLNGHSVERRTKFHSFRINGTCRLPPRMSTLIGIELGHSLVQEVRSRIKVEELRIGELGEVVVQTEILLLFCRHVVRGWHGVEVGQILRDVWCFATTVVTGHGCWL